MNYGFYIIMAAQFFSSLADNALLVAAIALLIQADAPSWLTPYLKFFFVVSYVLLAPYVGAFADRLPKGQVMFIANTIKIVGCVAMLLGLDPLHVANEGRFVAFVPAEQAGRALEIMRAFPQAENASLIGRVGEKPGGQVTIKSVIGVMRIVDMLSGEQLPRIC